MKQIFYKGLLALTIAFGVTSCDKNDVADQSIQLTKSDVKAGLGYQVTFSELGNSIVVPKLKGSEASKTASGFTHIYSDTDQVLTITGSNGDYSGTYTAGNISDLDPSDIYLAGGSYAAASSNASNESTDVVLGFLPYTSAINFDLSESRSIVLAATLERGFLIVNGEAEADDLNRISGATANGADLIGPDDEGDFYGYLLAGDHDIVINYLHDGQAATTEVSMDIAIGSAYTVEAGLLEESPAGPVLSSRTATKTISGNEADLGEAIEGTIPGRDINGDGDMIDDVERLSTTVTTTTDGDDDIDGGTTTLGAWSVVLDLHIVTPNDGTTTPSDGSVNPADEYISSVADAVITGGLVSSDDPAFGAWVVVEAPSTQALTSRSRTRVVRTTTTARISTVVTSYTIQVNGLVDVPALEEKADLSVPTILLQGAFIDATETETEDDFANPDYETPNGVDTWDVSGTYGGEEVLGALTYNDAPVDTSVQFYTRIGTQAYSITAAGNVETYNVVDAQDGSIVDGTTRNVETAAAQPGLSRQASSEADFANPNYEEPSDEAATGILTVVEVRSTFAGLTNTYTISSANGDAITAGDVITIVWGGLASGTVTVDITEADLADGAVTITVDRDFSTVVKS